MLVSYRPAPPLAPEATCEETPAPVEEVTLVERVTFTEHFTVIKTVPAPTPERVRPRRQRPEGMTRPVPKLGKS